ncbi:MAG: glycosyltransferase [Paludibacter sp.]|nr:glycosyltransferase [Paludibacter sp.]
MFLTILTIIISTLYLALIIVFIIGWKRVFTFVPKGNENLKISISVVVPCRNEAKNIRHFISSIAQQSYQNFELILVNDHSTDLTRSYIKNAQTVFPKIVLIEAEGYGKKNALKEGVLKAKSDFIVTTDADCIPSYHWLETLVCYQQKYPADLIICPVKLSADDNFLSHLQAIEFSTLVASGAAAAGVGIPILCNAANLAFTKQTWLNSREDLHEELISGDDIFLLQSVKKREGEIIFLKSESVFVTAQPTKSVSEFIHQRRRWASKSPAYNDWHIIYVACLILLISVWELILLALSFSNIIALILLGSLFLFKYFIDNLFLVRIKKFFQLQNTWLYSIPLSIIYPFYIVFVGITSILFKPKKWK